MISSNNMVATRCGVKFGYAYTTSLEPFSPIFSEMKVRLVKGLYVMIGMSTREVLQPQKKWGNRGWYVGTFI